MNEFSRSLSALERDSGGGSRVALAVAALLLGAWGAWFFGARVAVRVVSASARLEVDRAAHRIDALVRGRIVTSRLVVGSEVEAGDVLIELDAEPQRFELREREERLASLALQLERLEAEIAAKRRALGEASQGSQAAVDEADALAQLADSQAARIERLHVQGVVSDAERERGAAEARNRRAAVRRLTIEERSRDSDRRGELEDVRRRAAEVRGDIASTQAAVRRLEKTIEQHVIRAAVAGRIGEAADLPIGSVVDEGQSLGRLLPRGALRVVAEFLPSAALGRIRRGQPGRMRLEGFSWTQYGSLPLRVTSVSGETRAERVRVELGVDVRGTRALLQHGLPGVVEIEIERVSPAALALRGAGRLLDEPRAEARPTQER